MPNNTRDWIDELLVAVHPEAYYEGLVFYKVVTAEEVMEFNDTDIEHWWTFVLARLLTSH